jgi:hypothetical protein
MPWMNLGMLVLGVPPMLLKSSSARPGLNRFSLAILSSIGMVYGMSFGSYVMVKWLGPTLGSQFLVSFTGMTIGMLLGMFLCCEFGRAIALAVKGTKSP